MSNSINQVTLTGRLTKDMEVVKAKNSIGKLSVAVNRSYKKEGATEWTEETSFVDVTLFGNSVEKKIETARKGAEVIVTGRLQQDTWEAEGQKRSKIVVIADRVDVISTIWPTKAGDSKPTAKADNKDSIPF